MRKIAEAVVGIMFTDLFYMGTMARTLGCLIAGSAVFLLGIAFLGVMEYRGISINEEE